MNIRVLILLIVTAGYLSFFTTSASSQLVTETPDLGTPGVLPAGFSSTVTGGAGSVVTGHFQGRDSLIINAVGFGNIFTVAEWSLSGPVSNGAFRFSIYDEYGTTPAPYYMHVNVVSDSNLLYSFNWSDAGWNDPNITLNGPLLGPVTFTRTVGWTDFQVTWNPNLFMLQMNGNFVFLTNGVTGQPATRLQFVMHDYYAGTQSFAVSGLSVAGVPEPKSSLLVLFAICVSAICFYRKRGRFW
jgi:hypothetical protein